MLEAMRHLSLLYLQQEFDLRTETSLNHIRETHGSGLSSLLVEGSEKIKRAYILRPKDSSTVQLSLVELTGKDIKRLPFNKPSGSQSPAIGPVIKRTFADKKIGPTKKIQETTLKYFIELSKDTENTWGNYFAEIVDVLSSERLVFEDKTIAVGKDGEFSSILEAAISILPEKETVFLAVADKDGNWPGDRKEYGEYLSYVLAEEKYLTGETPIEKNQTCPLCGQTETNLYPNAVKGAGLNLYNVDREGAFDQLRKSLAWKSYSLCLDCADLLYIFKNHLMNHFITQIAGKKCLVLPDLLAIDSQEQQDFVHKFREYLTNFSQQTITSNEFDLLGLLKEQQSNFTIQIIFAKFGQNLDDITGVISEILPSRLATLSKINESMNNWEHVFAPTNKFEFLNFDLNLNFFYPLFQRPGGKRVDSLNDSVRLFDIKRVLASCIYREEKLSRDNLNVLWKEFIETARCYLVSTSSSQSLLEESDKYLSLAGWIHHLARFFRYLSELEVYVVEQKQIFQPEMEALKPYFTADSGINSLEKAFAFLLGVLFGKLVQVQSARGVNIQSNSLNWLKKLNLNGKDLPELYIKVREKILAYETSNSPEVRLLEQDLAKVAIKLGNDIKLNNVDACYFLLLGQSVSRSILPSKAAKEKGTEVAEAAAGE